MFTMCMIFLDLISITMLGGRTFFKYEDTMPPIRLAMQDCTSQYLSCAALRLFQGVLVGVRL